MKIVILKVIPQLVAGIKIGIDAIVDYLTISVINMEYAGLSIKDDLFHVKSAQRMKRNQNETLRIN